MTFLPLKNFRKFKNLKHLSLLLVPVLLAACTGTEEELPALRLVIADAARTLRSVDVNAPTTSPKNVTTTSDVVGLETLPNGTSVAVAFYDRIEVRDAELAVLSTFTATTFTPCFTGLSASNDGVRLALISSCTGEAQRVALFSSAGTLLFSQPLPLPTSDPATLRVAVVGDAVFVARPRIGGGGEVLRATATAVTSLLTTPNAIADLAAWRDTVYVSTGTSVSPINSATPPALGTALLSVGAERLFAGAGSTRFAAWDADTSGGTVTITDGAATATTSTVPFVTALRDAVFGPDGYLYLLRQNSLSRVDVVRLVANPTQTNVGASVSDGRFLAWVVPNS